jgi:microcompartment protein CcmL/EutN
MLPNDQINPVFLATVQATEEAVVNAMIAAETMTGVNGHMVIALPHDRLQEILKKYNRVAKQLARVPITKSRLPHWPSVLARCALRFKS